MDKLDRIGRRLKLHDLNVLTAVVRLGSMGKAAAVLNTTQPTISRSIAELEHALGVPLLDRDRRGVRPTEYGSTLLDCGAAVFDALREGVRSIESLADPTVGEVRIGGSSPAVASVLPAVFSRMRRQYPGLAIHVTELASVAQQYRALQDRSVDLVVGRIPQASQDEIKTEVLFHEQTLVVAGSRNRWGKRRKIQLAELAAEPWCLPPPDTLVGTHVAEAFRKCGMEFPPKGAATGSIHMLKALAESGPSLAILPGSILHFPERSRTLQRLNVDLSIPRWPVGSMTLEGRRQRPVVLLFMEHLRKATRPLADKSTTSSRGLGRSVL